MLDDWGGECTSVIREQRRCGFLSPFFVLPVFSRSFHGSFRLLFFSFSSLQPIDLCQYIRDNRITV